MSLLYMINIINYGGRCTMNQMAKLTVIILITMLCLFLACASYQSSVWIPIPAQEKIESNSLYDNLKIHAWVERSGSPEIIGAYLRFECTDSVMVDLSEPRMPTERGRMIADALDVWRMDTSDNTRQSIVNISGITRETSQKGKLLLGPGIYLAQALIFLEFHPEIKGADSKAEFDFGSIAIGDMKVDLNRISLKEYKGEKVPFGVPPDNSRVYYKIDQKN